MAARAWRVPEREFKIRRVSMVLYAIARLWCIRASFQAVCLQEPERLATDGQAFDAVPNSARLAYCAVAEPGGYGRHQVVLEVQSASATRCAAAHCAACYRSVVGLQTNYRAWPGIATRRPRGDVRQACAEPCSGDGPPVDPRG
jgi:hypothetical protein